MKKYYCIDCKKEIWYGSIRCKSCSKKGNKSPLWIDGRSTIKHFCIDCKKELNNFYAEKCKSCSHKGTNHPNYKDGRAMKKYYCKDCKKEICIATGIYGNNLCRNCSKKRLYKNPKRHPSYIHGQGNFPYPLEFTGELKEQIRKRDNYICQNCGMTEEEHLIVYGQILHVHHIDYNKENCKEDNLISTCSQCNARANHNRSYWQEFYINKINLLFNELNKKVK